MRRRRPYATNRWGVQALLLLAWLVLLAVEPGAEPVESSVDQQRCSIAVRTEKGGLYSILAGHKHGIRPEAAVKIKETREKWRANAELLQPETFLWQQLESSHERKVKWSSSVAI